MSEICPLSEITYFDYKPKGYNLKSTTEKLSDSFTMTKLESVAAGSKLTEGFSFIEKKEIIGHDLDAIVKIVNDRFRDKLSRGPVLYDTDSEDGNSNWSNQRTPSSKFKLTMYHLDEIPQPEKKTPEVTTDDIDKAIFTLEMLRGKVAHI